MIEQIKTYIKNGLNVIPVNHDKTPSCDWKHYQSNIIDNFKLFTTDAIAVVCGKISDNLMVLDFDNHQGTAKANLTKYIEIQLIKDIYEKYKLPVISTQSGGYHIYFRCSDLTGNEKLASVYDKNKKIDTIIEVRGEGGYVLAPPTNKYQIIRNDINDVQHIEPNEKIILYEVARSFNEVNLKIFKPKTDDQTPWNIYDNLPSSIDETKNLLKLHGWDELSFNNSWRRPGKNKGISATYGNVAPNVFYVFTSNSEFEQMKGYTPSSIKAILEHNSDFSACAKDLYIKLGLKPNLPVYQAKKEIKIEVENIDLKSLIFSKFKLDWDKEYTPPDFVIFICEGSKWFKIGSLGNFSCLTGKSKSRKSYAKHFFEASALRNGKLNAKFIVKLPSEKRSIVEIDTEQGVSNVFNSAYRMVKMAGIPEIGHYSVFALREMSYLQRCEALEIIIKENPNLGILFLDGVADLAFGNNDENEANRVVQLLMYLTAKYNIHIMTVIHQPKGSDWATGHLGSAIEKKAESVINIRKDGKYSVFEAKQLRNCDDFSPFPFVISEDGLPELINDQTIIDTFNDTDI